MDSSGRAEIRTTPPVNKDSCSATSGAHPKIQSPPNYPLRALLEFRRSRLGVVRTAAGQGFKGLNPIPTAV